MYWRDGSVRYDVEFTSVIPPLNKRDRPFPEVASYKPFSVIRTTELVTYSDRLALSKQGFREEKPPENIRTWLNRDPFLMSRLDPAAVYAKNVRTDEPDLKEFCEKATAVQSAESQATIELRLRRDDDVRMELTCDKAANGLPTKYRIGVIRNGLYVPWADERCEWRKTGDVWFPAHQVTIGYIGTQHKPVKFFDT